MSVRVAYGSRSNIHEAIQSGKIPKDCVIITDDNADMAELLFYDYQGSLKMIAERQKFRTMAEAEGWAKAHNCIGALFSIYDNGAWGLYIVQEDGILFPLEQGSLPDVLILDGGTSSGL